MNEVIGTYLGRTKFLDVWNLQREIVSRKKNGEIGDVFILNEHEPVYTIGKAGSENHLLATDTELRFRGVEIIPIDRGGDITYHGPGQLVGYPIIDLNNYYLDIHRYLRDLEDVIILTLKNFDINAKHDPDYTGVWVGNDKVAAIGIKVTSWITMHGFALNINTDLSYFDRIIPCGIFHKGVTSMRSILDRELDINEVVKILLKNFEKVFNCKIIYISEQNFYNLVEENKQKETKWLQVNQ